MANQGQSGGQVVIKLDSRLFYALLAGVTFLVALGLVFFVGLKLGQRNQPQTAAIPQPAFQQPGLQPAQPGNPIQIQPGQAQQAPFDQPAVRQARLPAGDEVPIGDNPRLALPGLAETNYLYDFGQV
ncbi:MAG: hypothetical protein ACE5F6_01710, partial [Anaerolineae bacterium]